ncbi:MAG TPA: hypothetical protein PLL10_02860 [Elusimicrobiales bacterium]|nr:hypothetical protein [Elusimicrobiales bacterium]
MLVKAKHGGKVPMEEHPRRHITDEKAVDVPETSYYKRLVLEGSLVPVTAEPKGGKK